MADEKFQVGKYFKIIQNDKGVYPSEMVNIPLKITEYHPEEHSWRIKCSFLGSTYQVRIGDISDITPEEILIAVEQEKKYRTEVIEGIKVCLQEAYEDNWDYKTSTRCAHEFIIRIPEVTTTNENNETHLHKDIFLSLYFDSNLKFMKMEGRRTTFTVTEYRNEFLHPHIGTGATGTGAIQYHSCCVGHGTPMEIVMNELRLGFDMEKFEAFLVCIDNWIKWESLTGGPYKRTNQLVPEAGNTLVDRCSVDSKAELYRQFLIQQDSFPLELTSDTDRNTYQVPLTEEFENICTKVLEGTYPSRYDKDTVNTSNLDYYYCVKVDGEYFPAYRRESINVDSINKSYRDNRTCILFKGEPFYVNIIKEDTREYPTEFICTPFIQKYIKEKLEKETNVLEYEILLDEKSQKG